MKTQPTLNRRKQTIHLFGNFGSGNFGNEATLLASLTHLRDLRPHAKVVCICSAPDNVRTTYNLPAVVTRYSPRKLWKPRTRGMRLARKLLLGIPYEVYRWARGVTILWNSAALIVPGTGLVTDAYSLLGWGPYDMFRWAVAAKLCRCKLLFLSVGAGPIYGRAARLFVTSALSLADFRSYRDDSSRQYVKNMGFRSGNDPVYPDLAFGLPIHAMPHGRMPDGRRLVVGLGLMEYAGKYGTQKMGPTTYAAYLETLVVFVKSLLSKQLDVRLLIGDSADNPVKKEFCSLLKERGVMPKDGRIIDDPINSVDGLLSQIAETDLVVATRFHNVLLSLLLCKPVIAIAFHHKCFSLMSRMEMSEYCHDINDLRADKLIETFSTLQKNAECLKVTIGEKVADCRTALDEQYRLISTVLSPE